MLHRVELMRDNRVILRRPHVPSPVVAALCWHCLVIRGWWVFALRRLFFWTPALVCTKRTDSFCTGWYLMWLDRQAELPLLLLCEACRACEVRLFVCLDKWGIVCAVLVCVLPAPFSAGVASALLHATLHTPHRCSQLILPIHPCTCTCSLGAYVPYRH